MGRMPNEGTGRENWAKAAEKLEADRHGKPNEESSRRCEELKEGLMAVALLDLSDTGEEDRGAYLSALHNISKDHPIVFVSNRRVKPSCGKGECHGFVREITSESVEGMPIVGVVLERPERIKGLLDMLPKEEGTKPPTVNEAIARLADHVRKKHGGRIIITTGEGEGEFLGGIKGDIKSNDESSRERKDLRADATVLALLNLADMDESSKEAYLRDLRMSKAQCPILFVADWMVKPLCGGGKCHGFVQAILPTLLENTCFVEVRLAQPEMFQELLDSLPKAGNQARAWMASLALKNTGRIAHIGAGGGMFFDALESTEEALAVKETKAKLADLVNNNPGRRVRIVTGKEGGIFLGGAEESTMASDTGEGLADRHNAGKPCLSFLLSAPAAMEGLARVFEFGANKYARDNWKKGLPETMIVDSLLRHLMAWQNGVDTDSESGLPHVDHVLWNAMALAEMAHTRPDMDDRNSPTASKRFVLSVRVTSAKFASNYVFESVDDARAWLASEFKELERTYGKLSWELDILPGLAVGDRCRVIGDGASEYRIVDLFEYSPNRYGFCLDSGVSEEVAKCYEAREK